MRLALLTVSAVLVLAGCGDDPADDEPASGITGQVLLGPQCPVESVDEPCDDLPAADVLVSASGDRGASTRTDGEGRYRLALPPGEYVVTADAGMSCESVAAHVSADDFVTVPVPCDTGIR